MTRLSRAAAFFVAANIAHSLDHVRRGLGGQTFEILSAGTMLTAAAVFVLVLALRDDPRAPVLCAGIAVAGALGIAASHLAPHWSALSDPFASRDVDALSWAVMLAEIAAALVLANVGLREMSRQTIA